MSVDTELAKQARDGWAQHLKTCGVCSQDVGKDSLPVAVCDYGLLLLRDWLRASIKAQFGI